MLDIYSTITIPKRQKKLVVICLASDANYEPHLWVTISSVIDSCNKNKCYHIYILDGGIKNKNAFQDLATENINISFVDMKGRFLNAYESRGISKAAYYRLAIFQIFKFFDRVVYIDADSYVLSDIAELYEVPMKNKLIAGVKDSITYDKQWREKEISFKAYKGKAINYYSEYLKLSFESINNYFSSGVLVINLKKINTEVVEEKLALLLKTDFFNHDQDILNLLFDMNEVFLLDRSWNFFNSSEYLNPEDFTSGQERNNYLQNGVDPKIISYVNKPWYKEFSTVKYSDLYWEKIKQSPYCDEMQNNLRKDTKLYRFFKLNLKGKVKYLTSLDARNKYMEILKKTYKK